MSDPAIKGYEIVVTRRHEIHTEIQIDAGDGKPLKPVKPIVEKFEHTTRMLRVSLCDLSHPEPKAQAYEDVCDVARIPAKECVQTMERSGDKWVLLDKPKPYTEPGRVVTTRVIHDEPNVERFPIHAMPRSLHNYLLGFSGGLGGIDSIYPNSYVDPDLVQPAPVDYEGMQSLCDGRRYMVNWRSDFDGVFVELVRPTQEQGRVKLNTQFWERT